ncbi:MAG TPA: hypothetical protein VI407_02095 [Erythrobacter sp.]
MSPAARSVVDFTDLAEETERLATLIRGGHPSLATRWLEPDGKYQTRGIALDTLTREVTDCLARHFRQRAPEDFPMLYCGWGKARVGSTALVNLFGIAGLPAYYQPVKAVLRHAVTGGAVRPWVVPMATAHPHIFSKDVAGPYLLAECLYIPLQMLVEAGYPVAKLHLIMLDREPTKALASWLAKWSDRVPEAVLVKHYVLAALNATRVERYARSQGVAVTHYVYEASRNPVASVRALFNRLGLATRFSDAGVTDWSEMGRLESQTARIIYPDEPAVYAVPGLHGEGTGYRYRDRGAAATDRYLDVLQRTGVEDVYRSSVRACVDDLGLDTAASTNLFDIKLESGVAAA